MLTKHKGRTPHTFYVTIFLNSLYAIRAWPAQLSFSEVYAVINIIKSATTKKARFHGYTAHEAGFFTKHLYISVSVSHAQPRIAHL